MNRAPPKPVADPERRRQINYAAAGLSLKSVMGGRDPLVMVNNGIYRVGDVISPPGDDVPIRFQVVSISKDSVRLLVEEPEYDLREERTLWVRGGPHRTR